MTIIESLLALQDTDARIRELELRLKDIPRRKALETAKLQGISTELASAKASLEYVRGRIANFEAEAKALREKIQQLKITQTTLQSNKEYQDFSVQIAMVNRDLETTENQMIAAMDEVPSAEARIEKLQASYDELKKEVDAFCAEKDAEIQACTEELAQAQSERAENVKAVADPKFMLYYERLRTKRWPVVVELTGDGVDGVCDGCHLVQPPSVCQLADANAKNGAAGKPQSIVACTMCGRLLHRVI